jgi:hypothetical protein
MDSLTLLEEELTIWKDMGFYSIYELPDTVRGGVDHMEEYGILYMNSLTLLEEELTIWKNMGFYIWTP